MQWTAPRFTIVCVIFSTLVSAASAQKLDLDSEIDKALRGRQFSRAIELIDAAMPTVEQAKREYLMFRRGLAQLYDGRHEAAIEHRERWHARVQRLSPRDEAPVERTPYVPSDNVRRRDPTPRTEVRQLSVRPNASKLALEDLERRVREEGNGHEGLSTV